MAAVPPDTDARDEPLIIHTHVSPWGFLVALPFAIVLAYLGAWALDVGVAHDPAASRLDNPLCIFSVPLIGFALFLFVVGVGELARYFKPAIEVVIDGSGVTTYGAMGARRIFWDEVVETRIDSQHVSLRARRKGTPKTLRLHFNRLAIEPRELMHRIDQHRPDRPPILANE